MGAVGGKRLYETADRSAVYIDPQYPVPLAGAKCVAFSRFTDQPVIVLLYPTGVIELLDIHVDSQRIEIDGAKEDLCGVTVLTVAIVEQILAFATSENKVVVVSHSTPMQQPPTWLLSGNDTVTFLRFTPDRKQLLIGHTSGRVNCVDIHAGLLSPIEGSHQELVPAAANPKVTDRVVAAARLEAEQVLVVTADQVQLWKPDGRCMSVIAVALPKRIGQARDCVFLKRRMFVLCDEAVWEVKSRRRGEKAKLTRVDGSVGWCIDVCGLLVWKRGRSEPKRVLI
ncbi:MAG: hypothetical protein CL678_11795 [Bdellovibrionaceae bacterium]|nr:hypothetical protein [Pseudobdellovibrionaceae bacterium]